MVIDVFKIPSQFEVRFVARAGGCERPHTHRTLIVSAVVEGSISLQINETETCLKNGTIAAIGPNVLHCARSYSPDFSGVYVLEILSFPKNSLKGFDTIHERQFGHLLWQDEQRYGEFIALCRKLLSREANSNKSKCFIEWLCGLFEYRYKEHRLPEQSTLKNRSLAASIKSLIDQNEEEKPPYEEITQVIGHSKEHCNRIFKQNYKLSIQSYFLNKKVALAKDMLDCEQSLVDIAHQCGFYDQSHFNRVFNQIYQVSPRSYRKAMASHDHSCTRNRHHK